MGTSDCVSIEKVTAFGKSVSQSSVTSSTSAGGVAVPAGVGGGGGVVAVGVGVIGGLEVGGRLVDIAVGDSVTSAGSGDDSTVGEGDCVAGTVGVAVSPGDDEHANAAARAANVSHSGRRVRCLRMRSLTG